MASLQLKTIPLCYPKGEGHTNDGFLTDLPRIFREIFPDLTRIPEPAEWMNSERSLQPSPFYSPFYSPQPSSRVVLDS